jgi:outer membrane protein assembly factor BamB
MSRRRYRAHVVYPLLALALVTFWSPAPGGAEGRHRGTIDWPQFHMSPDHKGFNRFETVLSPATVGGLHRKWRIQLIEIPFASLQNPVLADGVLYVNAYAASPPSTNSVFALDAATGDLIWQSEATPGGFAGAPAVAEGLVFAVGAFPGTLYALDQATGATVWKATITRFNNAYLAQPVVADGMVFVNSQDFPGKLFAFDAATGAELWSADTSNSLIGSPAVGGHVVYVGGQEGTMYAFRSGDGAPKWKTDLGVSGFTGIAVANGAVFAGSTNQSVYAFDADTGTVLWTFPTNDEIVSAPALAGGTVYIGTQGSSFYALRATTGQMIWRFDSGSQSQYFPGSPAVANGVVYEGEYPEALHAFDARTGEVLWSSSLPVAQNVNTAPVVADGVVYVTTYGGYVIAFSL